MREKRVRRPPSAFWALAREQHGVVTRRQLLDLGLTSKAVRHRIERGRLHPIRRGVYAVGRPTVGQLGEWMAAVLGCGQEALLGYRSAAALWGMLKPAPATIEIVVPSNVVRRQPGIRVHRRALLSSEDRDSRLGVPVTSPAATLVDCASQLGWASLEALVNAADQRELVDPPTLREMLRTTPTRPGVKQLRELLDRDMVQPTESWLERRFLQLVRSAALPVPQTQINLNGFRVDFYWPDLGLVVETDGLQYHRTPAQQARDLRREQAHAAVGLTALRFAGSQVRDEPATVMAHLTSVIDRLTPSP